MANCRDLMKAKCLVCIPSTCSASGRRRSSKTPLPGLWYKASAAGKFRAYALTFLLKCIDPFIRPIGQIDLTFKDFLQFSRKCMSRKDLHVYLYHDLEIWT